MSDLVGNPEDRFSHDAAHFIVVQIRWVVGDNFSYLFMKKCVLGTHFKSPLQCNSNEYPQYTFFMDN